MPHYSQGDYKRPFVVVRNADGGKGNITAFFVFLREAVEAYHRNPRTNRRTASTRL
jgi:hypothetical protein